METIQSFWTSDGQIFVKIDEKGPQHLIRYFSNLNRVASLTTKRMPWTLIVSQIHFKFYINYTNVRTILFYHTFVVIFLYVQLYYKSTVESLLINILSIYHYLLLKLHHCLCYFLYILVITVNKKSLYAHFFSTAIYFKTKNNASVPSLKHQDRNIEFVKFHKH